MIVEREMYVHENTLTGKDGEFEVSDALPVKHLFIGT